MRGRAAAGSWAPICRVKRTVMKTMPISRIAAGVGVRAALHFGDGDMGLNVVLVFVNVIVR